MKFTAFILSLTFIACALTFPRGVTFASAAHKFHTSFTEADYNAGERSLEITMRTFPDDLELILNKRNGKKGVRLDRREVVEPLLIAYLQETFELKNSRGEIVKLSWVGMDAGVDSVWLYFEARMPDGFEGAQLRNQFLFDLYDDQVNLVNVKQGERKRALTFKNGDKFQPLAPQ